MNTKNLKKTTMFKREFKIEPKFISKLIGPNGINIKAISYSEKVSKNRPNSKCFIEFKNNTCFINATYQDSVDTAYDLLQINIQKLKNNDLIHIDNKPKSYIRCEDSNIIAMVIGKRGSGIKEIVNRVKNGCYIIHKNGRFEISANTDYALQDAISLLRKKLDDIKNYFKFNQVYNKPQEQQRSSFNKDSRKYSGRFASLMNDDEPEKYRPKKLKKYNTYHHSPSPKNNSNKFPSLNNDFPTLIKNKSKNNLEKKVWGSGNINMVKNDAGEFKPLLKNNKDDELKKITEDNEEVFYSESDIKNSIGVCRLGNVNYSKKSSDDEYEYGFFDDSVDYPLDNDYFY
jgi:hypothetical protein